jgi:predicted DNA-binding transcriptional regulator AlpA
VELERFFVFNELRRLGIVPNRTSLSNWINKGSFPPGRLIGPNRRAWTESEIREYISERPTAPKKVLEGRRTGRPRKAVNQSSAVEA